MKLFKLFFWTFAFFIVTISVLTLSLIFYDLINCKCKKESNASLLDTETTTTLSTSKVRVTTKSDEKKEVVVEKEDDSYNIEKTTTDRSNFFLKIEKKYSPTGIRHPLLSLTSKNYKIESSTVDDKNTQIGLSKNKFIAFLSSNTFKIIAGSFVIFILINVLAFVWYRCTKKKNYDGSEEYVVDNPAISSVVHNNDISSIYALNFVRSE